MMFRWRRVAFGAMVTLSVCLLGVVSAARQAGPAPAQQMSEEVFQDIQVLKGMPADEFMDTMGMFASSLVYDCTGCHDQDILINRAAFANPTPRIQRARQMVVMVNALNRTYFGGEPRVTCFTCHRGTGAPDNIPDLTLQYGDGLPENPNRMRIFPNSRLSVDEVFSRYIQELGGADRLTALTSFVATGTYLGFNTGQQMVPIEIFASAPDKRATVVQMFDGEAIKTYDGSEAWAAEGWRQLPLMGFTGGNLAGARFEAMVSFPAGLQAAFSEWQVGYTEIDDQELIVAQGTNPGQLPVNLYFDESGMLVRSVRWASTPVGTVPTQTDYMDYREVAGVRMPFRIVVTWTNGRNEIELSEVRPNVQILPARFARPAPFTSQ